MGSKKRSSIILDKAEKRVAGMKSIDASLDLGNGLNLGIFIEKVTTLRNDLESYNTTLSSLDGMRTGLDEKETEMADLVERMLAGVASKYGKNSHEYEMAGGVRKSDIKRPVRKPKPTPAAAEG